MCRTGKVLYGSEERAWMAATYLIERRGFSDLKIYLCHVCKHFHLTTAPVQMHNWWWRKKQPKRVWLWFKQRGTLDQWDNE